MDEIDYKLRSQNPTLISHVSMARIIKHIFAFVLRLCDFSIVFLQAISKLIETIKKKKDISKVNNFLDNYDFLNIFSLVFILFLYIHIFFSFLQISEFKLLLTKCNSDDSIVSTSACQALVVLGETGLWDVKSALATFMACLSSLKYVLLTYVHITYVHLKRTVSVQCVIYNMYLFPIMHQYHKF